MRIAHSAISSDDFCGWAVGGCRRKHSFGLPNLGIMWRYADRSSLDHQCLSIITGSRFKPDGHGEDSVLPIFWQVELLILDHAWLAAIIE